jgi:hypothetical protein
MESSRSFLGIGVLSSVLACAACGSSASEPETQCQVSAECSGDTPWCNAGACVPLPSGYQLGVGDGTPGSVSLVAVYTPERSIEVTDVAFHPDRPEELWVLRREIESAEPCEENNSTRQGCASLEGSIAVVWNAGTPQARSQVFKDPNAWHFMRRPPAFAFGDNGTFATVGEARTGNFLDDPIDYMGPALWSSDLALFTVQPPGGNGSHLDMLHSSPFGVGIAHEAHNVYWVFNGQIGSLDRYDFREDHGPGQEFHGDGEMLRYVSGELLRKPGVPGHLALDRSTRELFAADTGNGRIVKLSIDTGTPGARATPNYDFLSVFDEIDGATLVELVAAGMLEAPSGLVLHAGLLFVSDNAKGMLHAFDREGKLVRSLDTGLPAGSLAGLAIGPDDRLYLADMPSGTVYRVDPKL